MSITKLIIPEGQSTRWVLKNYYDQPENSLMTDEQAIHHRNYFNTLFRNEADWNNNENTELFRHLWADNRRKYSQIIRQDKGVIRLRYLINKPLTGLESIVLRAYSPQGVPFTALPLSLNYIYGIDNINFRNTYNTVKTHETEDGKIAVYFQGSITNINAYQVEDMSYFGNIPENIEIGDLCSFLSVTNEPITDIIYIESLNVMALKFNVEYTAGTPSDMGLQHFKQISEYNTVHITINKEDLPQNECFYLSLEYYNDKSHAILYGTWESELLTISNDIANTVKFQWKDIGKKIGLLEYNYLTEHTYSVLETLILPAYFYEMSTDLPESEVYNDNQGRGRLISTAYSRRYTVVFEEPLPRYIFETLKIAMRHTYFYINNKRYVPNPATFETEKQEGGMLFTGQFEMTEYAITGVFDTDDYDWEQTTGAPYRNLLIDSNNYLLIGNGKKLRIN